ncbi:Dual specificity protein phosphatase 1-B [Grifola frondosa]|uniref:protein-tyrosine-phosphatase n=1 Tax=Grifola frondosa TaxID=5627 RepID=A0A1C7MCD8_GRIFR|nr:Dual specificity protein phosphatase 1-B [Grifola frondosa]
MAPPKKGRPPTLTVQTATRPGQSNTIIELETPVESPYDLDDDDDLLQLSSPSSASSDSPIGSVSNLEMDSDTNADDISKDLAVLEQLRRSVHKNLKLRPIRSASSSLRVQNASASSYSSWSDLAEQTTPSPTSSISPSSVYYTPISALYADTEDWKGSSFDAPSKQPLRGMDSVLLVARLSAPTRPLLIDTRPLGSFLANRLKHSINIQAIPSLILKRCRKPNGGLHDLDALRQFITTEGGKRQWDEIMASGDWDGDVVIYDENMDEREQHNPYATAWTLLAIVEPLLEHGGVDYLQGGLSTARQHPYLRQFMISDDRFEDPAQSNISPPTYKPGGLFHLDIAIAAARSKNLPEIEKSAVSPKLMMPSAVQWHGVNDYSAPSPAPSQIAFSRPPPPRRPSIPTLRKIDTSSAERLNAGLPKLQLSFSITLRQALHDCLQVALIGLVTPPSPSYAKTIPHTPISPDPRTPSTARPDTSQPPTTEEPFPVFAVSTILPNFLFLGPELTAEEHVEELLSLGVKRILNIAAECDDDHGLRLRDRFDRYVRIPMRDTVEEDNITRGVREVCEILDDARLHSSPTYVHCKAGKSRSVTAVMAYLIHANHWTLSRAYAFVLERRKGISPNIGFVSELMTFEEQELGGKSVGVVKMTSSDPDADDYDGGNIPNNGANYQVAVGGRRPQHIRESLPPLFTTQHSFAGVSGPPLTDPATLGDSGQEMEIKDSSGRYRHARRAPVDEATLQPLRRVSKAGLESAAYI